MSTVSDQIVREYFESLGFLVRQPTKYRVQGRSKEPVEQIDFVVWNPQPARPAGSRRAHRARRLVWDSSDLRGVARAIVSVHGWHSERITPAVLKFSPEVLKIAEEEVARQAVPLIGKGPVARVVCLPGLPASTRLRERTLQMLRERGVDGVLLFRTMLLELIRYVQRDSSYDHSPLLQLLRILKSHDLLGDAQMPLFPARRRRRPSPPDAEEGR